jgi:DNA-binding CsgD family transcriptional regulator
MNVLPQPDTSPTIEMLAAQATFQGCGEREKACARLVLRGMENKQIGIELGIATRTVKAHLNRIYLRLGIGLSTIPRRISRVGLISAMLDMEQPRPGVALCQLFTDAQITLLDFVGLGLRNREIGVRLHTTEYVIKNYMRAIYDRAGVNSRTELVVWWRCHRGEGRGRAPRPGHNHASVATASSAGVCKTRLRS